MVSIDTLRLDVPVWSRNFGDVADEEDLIRIERQAAAAWREPVAPMWIWSSSVERGDATTARKVRGGTLIVALGVAPTIVAGELLHPQQVLGTLLLPEVPVVGHVLGATPDERLLAPGCVLYRLGASDASDSDRSTLLALCNQAVPDARALAWAEALLDAVQVERVLVLDTLPMASVHERGEDGEALAPPALRRLETSHVPAGTKSKVAKLTVPTVVHGSAAALLTAAELEGVALELFVSVTDTHYPLETMIAFEEALLPFRTAASISATDAVAAATAARHTGFLRAWERTRAFRNALRAAGDRTLDERRAHVPLPSNVYS